MRSVSSVFAIIPPLRCLSKSPLHSVTEKVNFLAHVSVLSLKSLVCTRKLVLHCRAEGYVSLLFALWGRSRRLQNEDRMFLGVLLTRRVITANLGVYIKEVNQPARVVRIAGGGCAVSDM